MYIQVQVALPWVYLWRFYRANACWQCNVHKRNYVQVGALQEL